MIKGDKIKLVKPMGAFTDVGEVCEITDVAEGGVVSFRFGGVHLGCMSYDEYEKYFEKVDQSTELTKKKWTDWIDAEITYVNFDGEVIEKIIQHRNNGVRVQARCGEISARSSCHASDVFYVKRGLDLASRRLIVKLLAKDNKIYAAQI